ncbi:MAG: GspE/PulE family protein [Desulfobacterales bacterium]|nr:GspE/PulE family protein [Desulfobacterales bacterium]
MKTDDRKIGQILIDEGVATESQLEKAFQIQKSSKVYKPIGQILVQQKVLTQNQLNYLLNRHLKRALLGQILIKSGLIDEELLQVALQMQKQSGRKLGDELVQQNFITEESMRKVLCTQLNIPFVDLQSINIDFRLAKVINKSYARRHKIIPVFRSGDTLTLAMDDPTNVEIIEELQSMTGLQIKVVTASSAGIEEAFTRLYEVSTTNDGTGFGIELLDDDSEEGVSLKYVGPKDAKTADQLVQQIIRMGLEKNASDIHIESGDRQISVRFRTDGVLKEPFLGEMQGELNSNRRQVISRIKVLGKLDIAERRRPQDGSFRAQVLKEDKPLKIDFRLSVLPGYYGENIVIRILDARNAPKSIENLGFSGEISLRMRQLLGRSHGIVLITGPTGSGKSTTLYGGLMTVFRPGIKILTAEDPIEYVYDGITQCEVNRKIGNTFAAYIRAFLRQDPEVIMVGEIRDEETAEMAFGAAQTGHLVLSTLHTNDAISSVSRLLGLGVDRNQITSSLLGVLSQRLVRMVCPECKEEYIPSEELLREFFREPPEKLRYFRGQKCSVCNYTGYKGRVAVAQLWTPNDNDILLINKGVSLDEIRRSSYASTTFMLDEAMKLLRDGKTNLEELIRALPYMHIYESRAVSAKAVAQN